MIPLYDDNPHQRFPWITVLLIAINAFVHFQVSQLLPNDQFELYAHYGFIPKRIEQLRNPQLVVAVPRPEALERAALRKDPVDPNDPADVLKLNANAGEIYLSLLTMMFLHGGWMHLIGNMWFLWLFGNNCEDRLGHFLFVFFYLIGGLLASGLHWFFATESVIPAVGASGAVAAVLGGYAVSWPTAKVRCLVFLVVFITLIDVPAMLFLGLWFVMELANAFAQQKGADAVTSGVAFWAHVGGFLAGMVLMPLLSLGSSPPGADWNAEAEEQFRPLRS